MTAVVAASRLATMSMTTLLLLNVLNHAICRTLVVWSFPTVNLSSFFFYNVTFLRGKLSWHVIMRMLNPRLLFVWIDKGRFTEQSAVEFTVLLLAHHWNQPVRNRHLCFIDDQLLHIVFKRNAIRWLFKADINVLVIFVIFFLEIIRSLELIFFLFEAQIF